MLTKEENERVTRVGSGTPMGELIRRYWVPALLAWELPEPDCPPVRVRLLGEELVAFRDTNDRIGLLEAHCAYRRANLNRQLSQQVVARHDTSGRLSQCPV